MATSTVPIVTGPTESDDASVFAMPETNSISSCAFHYNDETLAERSWAFDGTLVSIGALADSQMGNVPAATFDVNHWYRGGSTPQVTVQFETGKISGSSLRRSPSALACWSQENHAGAANRLMTPLPGAVASPSRGPRPRHTSG